MIQREDSDRMTPAEAGPVRDKTAGGLGRGRKTFYVITLAVCLVLIYFLWVREMRFFQVPSRSMEPAFYPRDYILTLNASNYRRGDIVVVIDPEAEGAYLVKRIVGVGGDSLFIIEGALYLNGSYASEPYTAEPGIYSMNEPPGAPYVVAEDEVFVLGDNRNNSDDSHSWKDKGIPVEDIVGKVRLIYLPFDRAGPVRPFALTNLDEN